MSFTFLPPVETFGNNDITTLTAPVAVPDTTISVASVASFPTDGQFRLLIDSELLLVMAYDSVANQFQVTRGIEGTTAASHSSGVQVTCILTKGSLATLKQNAGPLFIYRDSEPNPTGNVFSTFDDAYVAAHALGVPSTLLIDDSIAQCSTGNAGGFGASVTSVVGTTATITGLFNMTPAVVGLTLNIQNATSAGNNGNFPITAYLSPTSVQITNPSAVAPDASNRNIGWFLFDGLTASVPTVINLTLVSGMGGLTSAIVGQPIEFFDTGQPGNAGTFTVVAFASPTAVWVNNPTAASNDSFGWGTVLGSTASVSAFDGVSTATITGLSGITPAMVGQTLHLMGAASSGNNGSFTITAYISSSSLQISNGSAVAPDVNNGSISWVVGVFGARVTTVQTPIATVTGLAGISPSMVGNALNIQNSTNANVSLSGSAATITGYSQPSLTITGLTGITPLVIGQTITINNSGVYGNNGNFIITATSGTGQVSYSNGNGVIGTHASVTTVVGTTATITGLANINPFDVGVSITLGGAASAGNNGSFPITAVLSANSVQVTNASAVANDANNGNITWNLYANNGSIQWSINFPQTNSIISAIVGYISPTSVLWGNPTPIAPDPNNGSLWWYVGTNYDLSQIALVGEGQFSPFNINDGATFNQGIAAISNVQFSTQYNYQNYAGTLGLVGVLPTTYVDRQASFDVSGGRYIFDLSLGNPGNYQLVLDHGASVTQVAWTGNNYSSSLGVTMYAGASVDQSLIGGANGSVSVTVLGPSNSNPPIQFNNFYGTINAGVSVSYQQQASALVPFTGSGTFPTPTTGTNPGAYNITIGTMYFDQITNAAWWWNGTSWVTYNGGGYITTANVLQGGCNPPQTSNLASGDHVTFNTFVSGGSGPNVVLDQSTPYTNAPNVASVGRITLATAPTYGHFYKLTANLNAVLGSGAIWVQWYVFNSLTPNGSPVGNPSRIDDGATLPGDFASHGDCVAYVSTRPGDGGQALVELRILSNSGMTALGSTSVASVLPWFTVDQVF